MQKRKQNQLIKKRSKSIHAHHAKKYTDTDTPTTTYSQILEYARAKPERPPHLLELLSRIRELLEHIRRNRDTSCTCVGLDLRHLGCTGNDSAHTFHMKGPRDGKIRKRDACFCCNLAQGRKGLEQQFLVAALTMTRLRPVAVEVTTARAVHWNIVGRHKLSREETL